MFGAATNAADGGGSSDHGLRRQTRSVVSHLGSCSGGYGTSSSSTSYDAPGLRRFSEASRVSTRRDCYPDLMLPAVDEADTFDAMLGMSDDDDAMPNATSDGRSSTSRRGSSRATRKQLGLPPARCWDPVFTWWWRLKDFLLDTKEDDSREAIDVELEEMEMSPRYRPGSISYLCQKTRFSEQEIKSLYRGFKAECPSGIAKEDTFKHIYSQFFPPEANSGQYAHYLFRTLDNIGSKTGLVSFEDFVMSLSTLCRGTTEEKIKWLFVLYDQDGDGKISRTELANMVVAVFGLMANHASPPIDDDCLLVKIDEVFQTLDQNKDGVITMEEFVLYCCSDAAFLTSLSMLEEII